MTKWVTVSEASVILGVSERTLWRRVAKGSIEARLEGGRKLVKIDENTDNIVRSSMTLTDKNDIINWLKAELENKNKQIDQLQAELKLNRERSDAIIMKLTQELEYQRKLFQGLKQDKKKDRSFWKLLGKSDDSQDN